MGYTLTIKMRKEVRCGNCKHLLAKDTAIDLEIKSTRCGVFDYVGDSSTRKERRDHKMKTAQHLLSRRRNFLDVTLCSLWNITH